MGGVHKNDAKFRIAQTASFQGAFKLNVVKTYFLKNKWQKIDETNRMFSRTFQNRYQNAISNLGADWDVFVVLKFEL